MKIIHRKEVKEKKNGEEVVVYKKKRFIELWLNDPKIRKYDNYAFIPPPKKIETYIETYEYNTWTNFDIVNTPYDEKQKDYCLKMFLDYCKKLFDNRRIRESQNRREYRRECQSDGSRAFFKF